MAKPEWGTKRTCTSCGAKFYDFQKTPILCPKCGAENRPVVLLKPKRAPTTGAAKPARKPVQEEKPTPEKDLVVENADDEDDDAVDDDDGDGVVLDDDEVALTGLSGEAADEEEDEEQGKEGGEAEDEADKGAADGDKDSDNKTAIPDAADGDGVDDDHADDDKADDEKPAN